MTRTVSHRCGLGLEPCLNCPYPVGLFWATAALGIETQLAGVGHSEWAEKVIPSLCFLLSLWLQFHFCCCKKKGPDQKQLGRWLFGLESQATVHHRWEVTEEWPGTAWISDVPVAPIKHHDQGRG